MLISHLLHTNLIKVALLFSFFASCSTNNENNEAPPSNVLTEEQMIQVLTDAYLAEGASSINIKNATGEKYDSVYQFNPIKDNQIKKSTFDSSITYYSKHPKKLKIIYDKVLDKLSVIQAKGKLD